MEEKLIIRNKTDLPIKDIFQMASQVTVYDDDFEKFMATTFYGGYVCLAKRNKASITLTFIKKDKK